MNNFKYNTIKMTPFKWFVLENFPFIEEDFDSLTSYGLWCKLKEYFDEVSTKTNKMGTQVESLTNAFIVLKDYVDNYFKNLDVQDEINNKLDEMVEDGTLEELLNNTLINIKPNEYFDIKLGTSTWYQLAQDGGESALNNTLKYFNSIIQCGRLKFNSNNNTIESNDDNIELQITNINNYLNKGGKIEGLKFHLSNLLELFQTFGSTLICEKYGDYILNFISNLPYKNQISKIFIFNEGSGGSGNDAFSATYAQDIIILINRLKTAGYYVSIPLAGVYPLAKIDKNLFESLDFISLNLYPKNDYWGKFSSIEQVADRFNYLFDVAEQYLDNRDLYITEFGCSASWEGFSTPETYNNKELSKPMALFMEGFFKSKFLPHIKGAFWWYYQDAFNYIPKTLLSIKQKGVIRYE